MRPPPSKAGSPALDLREIGHARGLRTWLHRGDGDRLVVCFSGIGPDLSAAQGYDFPQIATRNGQYTTLFVADTERSWLNGEGMLDDLAEQVTRIAADAGLPIVQTLGYSMGAYCALILGGLVEVECAVAYAPQFSINPAVVPDERRWRDLRHRISQHRIRSVADYLNAETRYVVFHGGLPRDRLQRDPFVATPNLMHVIFPEWGHSVAPALRGRKILDPVTWACLDGNVEELKQLLSPLSPTYHGGDLVGRRPNKSSPKTSRV